MTQEAKDQGPLSRDGQTSWKLLVIVGGIVWSSVQTVAAVRAMNKTDEVLVAIATLQQQVRSLDEKSGGLHAQLRALEDDRQRVHDRLQALETYSKMSVKSASFGPP